MAYGILKCDTVTFTNAGVDKSVTLSGLVQNPTFSGNVTVTGTVSGTTATFTTGTFTSLTGTTSQGTTATYTSGSFTSLTGVTTSGTTANFVSGVFTTQISGATITGTAGAFATLTGGVATLTSGVFALGTQALPSITFAGDTDTGIYSPGANQVAITTSGTGRLFVDASGKISANLTTSNLISTLGVGVADTNNSLASSAAGISIVNTNSSAFNRTGVLTFGQGAYGDAQALASVAGVYTNYTTSVGGALVFSTNNGSGSFGERLRITSAGLVGVGASDPTEFLDLRRANGAGNLGIRLVHIGQVEYKIGINDSDDKLYITNNNGDAAIGANATGIVITPTGSVGIGVALPLSTFHVQSAAGTEQIRWTDNTNGTGFLDTASGLSRIYSNVGLAFGTGSATFSEHLRITSAGLVGVGTSSPNSIFSISAGAKAADNNYLFLETTDASNKLQLKTSNVSNTAWSIQSEEAGIAYRSLALNPLGGNVGIGTTSPSELLHLTANANPTILLTDNQTANTNGSLSFRNGTYRFDTRFNGGNGVFVFTANNASTEYGRFDTSGRLLVGTSSRRRVGTPFDPVGGVFYEGSGAASYEAFIAAVNRDDNVAAVFAFGKSRGTTNGSNTIVVNGDELGVIRFAGADGTDLESLGAEIKAEVDGTPAYAATALVNGQTYRIVTVGTTNFTLIGASANTVGTVFTATGPGTGTGTAILNAGNMPGRLVFSTTADGGSSLTERMRITNGGSLFTFNSTNDSHEIRTALAAGTTNNLILGAYGATNNTGGGTAAIAVRTNGNIENANNSYAAFSDAKLKENIVDATSQWNDVKALQVRKYNFKEGQTHTQIGLIAQEVELVSPGLVSESPDRDEDGNDLGTVTKSVNYSVLYMKAVKALQEAMERIETLEAKVAALESA